MTRLLIIVVLCVGPAALQGRSQQVDQNSQASRPAVGQYVVGSGYSNIQAAITAAGQNGTVVIPPNYPGTDLITAGSGNQHNLRISDQRPLNPANAATYQNTYPAGPQTTLKASDYGAVCNGDNDDTVAINHALKTLSAFMGGANSATRYMGPSAVELPQGRCVISASLVSTDYGSILGSPGGTWLTPKEPWLGTDPSLILVTSSYSPNSAHGAGPPLLGSSNRQVRGISFSYNYNATAHTAIKVISGYGHTNAAAYPNVTNPQPFQLQQVSIMDNNIFAMDTAIDLEDCGECEVFNNYISFVRVGIWDNGNNYSLITRDNSILNGSNRFTPITGTTSGLMSNSATRYSCTGGTGSECAGGRITGVVSSPQGFSIFGTTIEHFGIAGNFINVLGVNIGDGSCLCDSTQAVYLNQPVSVNFTSSTFSTSAATGGVVIEISAPTANPATGLAQNNGWWIDGNSINTDNNSFGTATGIQLDAGTYPLVNLDLSRNQFFGFNNAVVLNAPLTYSRITDNYGDHNRASLFTLNASGSGSFLATVIANNTSRDALPILVDRAGGGYVLGYNQSVSQLLGPQTTATSGCTITPGAIGNECSTPVTVTWPKPFADSAYNVTCVGQGGSGAWTAATANIINGSSFTINEIALSPSAAGGGALVCTGIHN